jgi:hypothetical protein
MTDGQLKDLETQLRQLAEHWVPQLAPEEVLRCFEEATAEVRHRAIQERYIRVLAETGAGRNRKGRQP